jgi:hypothetical protein
MDGSPLAERVSAGGGMEIALLCGHVHGDLGPNLL